MIDNRLGRFTRARIVTTTYFTQAHGIDISNIIVPMKAVITLFSNHGSVSTRRSLCKLCICNNLCQAARMITVFV